MDSMQAFARGEAARKAGARGKVFDWDEAARRIVKSGFKDASAGLSGDWEWTGGDIFRDGKPVPKDDTHTYLASVWATPELTIEGVCIEEPCYVDGVGANGWDAGTYWPESALKILEQGR